MNRFFLLLTTVCLSKAALAVQEPPVGAPELRSSYASLNAAPGVPAAVNVNFSDAQVLLNSITVDYQSVPDQGSCRMLVHINNQLAKVLIQQPPGGVSEIRQPPVAIPALTWNAQLDIFGVREPPGGIIFTPNDGMTIILESDSEGKEPACSANVLVVGSVYGHELADQVTPINTQDLRTKVVSLRSTPEVPGETKLSFSDPSVLVGVFDVIPIRVPEQGRCKTTARINELLARIQIQQPPVGIAGIQEPPGGIDGVTLAGIREPPVGIVFAPGDTLKLALESEVAEKNKDGTCAADILILGTVYNNGQ